MPLGSYMSTDIDKFKWYTSTLFHVTNQETISGIQYFMRVYTLYRRKCAHGFGILCFILVELYVFLDWWQFLFTRILFWLVSPILGTSSATLGTSAVMDVWAESIAVPPQQSTAKREPCAGVGFAKAPFVNFSIRKILDLEKVPFMFF